MHFGDDGFLSEAFGIEEVVGLFLCPFPMIQSIERRDLFFNFIRKRQRLVDESIRLLGDLAVREACNATATAAGSPAARFSKASQREA
ncbi:hypothetical protein D3C72_1491170 [compost metagenome]